MRLSHIVYPLAAVAIASSAATKRQFPGQPLTILSPGSISAPADGTQICANAEFALGISNPVPEWNHCHPLYTPVHIYLLAEEPTVTSLNSTFQFSDYLYYYGEYVVTNIQSALPPQSGSPPPSILTMPDLGAAYEGQQIYLATVETIFGCPPTGYTEYAIDSAGIVYHE